MSQNKLQVIVKESGLDVAKGKFLLNKFQNYFEIAAEWETKAKTLLVTEASQTAEMQMARTGRLFLREKRIAVEKARKELKEQSLREGKAIDGIANVLKALIIPIEEYLQQQENFVKIQEEKKAEAVRLEVEERMEKERIAKEKAEAEERERIRIENERLKKEAKKRERQMAVERKKQEEKLAAQKAKAASEKAKQQKMLDEQKAKAEAEKKALEEKARKEKEAEIAKARAEREEKERLAEILKNQVECPFCHKKFALNQPQ